MSDYVLLSVRRPYDSEEALLEHEAWTITKKSVFLIGIPPHPEGERVRCQLALESGTQLLVAEGVVSRHVEATGNRASGLVVRFRRMSAASSQFVNRALGARENAEKSSPSSTEASAPISEVCPSEVTTSQPSLSRPTASRIVPGSTTSDQDVSDALRRLSGRSLAGLPEVSHRAAALERLRLRHNASH